MQGEVKLSARLTAIAQMVSHGKRACDVGCDHGFVSIYLVQQGICPSVLAMDVRKGPLQQANTHIARAGLEAQIVTRLSDGLEKYHEGEAQTLILAGMGGRLMMKILADDKAKDFEELVLAPQSEVYLFRRFLKEEGWKTVAENMIYEDGKFYPLIKVVPCDDMQNDRQAVEEQITSEMAYRFGELLLEQKNEVLLQFLHKEERKLTELLQKLPQQESQRNLERRNALEEELENVKKAKSLF